MRSVIHWLGYYGHFILIELLRVVKVFLGFVVKHMRADCGEPDTKMTDLLKVFYS